MLRAPFLLVAVAGSLAWDADAASPWSGATVTRLPDGALRQVLVEEPGAVMGSTPELAARAVANRLSLELGLRPGSELAVADVARTRLGPSVRFAQKHSGLPVLDGELVVTLTRDNRLRRLSNSIKPIAALKLERQVDKASAIAAAAAGIDGVLVTDGKPIGATRDVLWVDGTTARLAYQVHVGHLNPLMNLYVLVDAGTGERLSVNNRVFFADGARFFDPSPGRDCDRPTTATTMPDLATPRDPNGWVVGDKLDTTNCCYHEGCDSSKGPLRLKGTLNYGGFVLPYDIVICDRKPRATNTQDCRNDYVYRWEPEPTANPGADAADEDPFAEVNAYVHASRAYAWFRDVGDPAFKLRDQKQMPPQRTSLWVNLLIPDLSQISFPTINITRFMRVDNAAFMPREGWAQIPLPIFGTITNDTLILFQGDKADFAYDASVIQHEFAHGVIFSTAAFQGTEVDHLAANNEGGALHEGYSDYFSAAMRNDPVIGEFVAPRMASQAGLLPDDVGMRDLRHHFTCPSVIEGEVHQDGQHFSEALWAGRLKLLGTDNGKTYDGAIYDGMVSLVSSAGFDEATAAMKSAVATAFPGAGATFEAEFASRGVIGCSKVLDLPQGTTRARFGIVARNRQAGPWPFAPGPIQFRVPTPQGATAVKVQFNSSGGLFGTSAPVVRALVKATGPIEFGAPPAKPATQLTYDPDAASALGAYQNPTYTIDVPLVAVADGGVGDGGPVADAGPPACATAVYLALASEGGEVAATDVTAIVTPDPACPFVDAGYPTDAGTTDAGTLPPAILCRTRDAGPGWPGCPPDAGPIDDAGATADSGLPQPTDAGSTVDAGENPQPPGGCGCTAAGAAPFCLLALAVVAARRRRASAS